MLCVGHDPSTPNASPERQRMEHVTYQPDSPWKKFTHRQEAKHRPEDDLRLCTLDQTSAQVIERFLSPERDKIHLDELIPRRRQVLRDFLNGVHPEGILGMGSCLQDVKDRSNDDNIIALVDDRQNHERCDKIIGKPCNDCRIFSRSVGIPELCERMQEKVNQSQQ